MPQADKNKERDKKMKQEKTISIYQGQVGFGATYSGGTRTIARASTPVQLENKYKKLGYIVYHNY